MYFNYGRDIVRWKCFIKKNEDKFREKGECIGSIDIVNIFVL